MDIPSMVLALEKRLRVVEALLNVSPDRALIIDKMTASQEENLRETEEGNTT